MTSILERFAAPSIPAVFRPKTVTGLFALRLAQKLNDASAVAHYVSLTERCSEAQLLAAFRRTTRSGVRRDLGRQFHWELERINGSSANGRPANLIAIRVERRAIAAAIFYNDQLEYTQVRQLSSAKDKVLGSAIGFVNWLAEQFSLDSAALELISGGQEIQRQVLSRTIAQTFRERLLPIWEVPKLDLFNAYGYPPLRSRKELRQVVTDIWPVLGNARSQNLIHDAAALGLHVQIERSFLH